MPRMVIRHVYMGLLCGAVLLVAGPLVAETWPPPPETAAVLLHQDLPETLDRAWIERLDLFPGVAGLQSVRFGQAPWGSVLARLEVSEDGGEVRIIVRSLAGETWRELQQRAQLVAAGEPLPPRAPVVEEPDVDPLAEARAWPETPPPPSAPLAAASGPTGGPVPVRGKWLALVEAGVRTNVSSFETFFTPMGQVGVAFAYGASERFLPGVSFGAGFGDMQSDFEDEFGDGRANSFSVTLTALLRQPIASRHSLYVEGGGGFFLRSLFWGGSFYNPTTGDVTQGRVVEQSDFGWTARVGWMLSRNHPRRPRFLDVGLGFQSSSADPWIFTGAEKTYFASGRDTWVFLTVRFWDGI